MTEEAEREASERKAGIPRCALVTSKTVLRCVEGGACDFYTIRLNRAPEAGGDLVSRYPHGSNCSAPILCLAIQSAQLVLVSTGSEMNNGEAEACLSWRLSTIPCCPPLLALQPR